MKKWKNKLYPLFLAICMCIAAPVWAADTSEAVYYQVAKFLPEPSLSEVTNDILDASAYFQVDPILIAALFTCESGFYEGAISPSGAIGIAQLMPGTASSLGVNPYNTRDNIFGGVEYLREQLDTFGGDYVLAEAAYNAGPGAVIRYGGVPPYTETINYVDSVEAVRGTIWAENSNNITPYYDTMDFEADTEDDKIDEDDDFEADKTDADIPSSAPNNNSQAEPLPEPPTGNIRFSPPSVR